MIIVGYPGIGKTSLANWHNDYLDVDSSSFIFDGVRPRNWASCYAKMVEDLSEQGYRVFVSSHKDVRDALKDIGEVIFVVCPCLELKEEWRSKLHNRWVDVASHKNFKAWKRAEEHYDEDITDLLNSPWPIIEIKDMSYELDEIIDAAVEKMVSQETQLLL